MKVMKFGGTSVGTVESINSVRNIVAGEQAELVVVVSALGGITNLLIKTANDAVAGGYEEGLSEIRKRHESVMSGVLPGGADDVKTKIGGLLSELATEYEQIKEAGMKAGVTINPATPVSMLADIIDDIDLALIMSVNPGFGGQKFIQNSVKKVHELRDLISLRGSKALIEVDGGVNEETGRLLKDAGADILVAGNYVFGAENPLERISTLKNL